MGELTANGQMKKNRQTRVRSMIHSRARLEEAVTHLYMYYRHIHQEIYVGTPG